MPAIQQTLKANCKAEDLYKVISDFESYPEFLPWCKNAKILDQKKNDTEVDIEIAKGSLSKSFTTINHLKKNKSMEMKLEKGPFKKLEASWKVVAKDKQHCEVQFNIDYEFSNLITRKLVGPVFAQVAEELTQAFIDRAVS